MSRAPRRGTLRWAVAQLENPLDVHLPGVRVARMVSAILSRDVSPSSGTFIDAVAEAKQALRAGVAAEVASMAAAAVAGLAVNAVEARLAGDHVAERLALSAIITAATSMFPARERVELTGSASMTETRPRGDTFIGLVPAGRDLDPRRPTLTDTDRDRLG